MNGNELLDKFSDVDGKLIEAAENKPKKKKLFIAIPIAAAAAAVAIAIGINSIPAPPVDYGELPILSLDDNPAGAWGFEAYEAKDPTGLENGCPWNENTKLTALPVYKSSSNDPDIEKMRECVKTAAAALGIDEDKLEITEEYDEDFGKYRQMMIEQGLSEEEIETEMKKLRPLILMNSSVTGETDGVSLRISTDYTLSIFFEPYIELPDEYNISDNATDEEKQKAFSYLLKEYKELIDIKNPAIRQRKDYNGIDVYDKSGGIEEQIVNFSLNHVDICDYDGKLWIIRIYSNQGCEKVGDYPIISAKEAEELLRKGQYLTSGRDFRESDQPVRVELTYRSGIGYNYVMPFYKFFVELEEESSWNERGNTLYGAYYVPAVQEKYIENMPAEISFNGGMIGFNKLEK